MFFEFRRYQIARDAESAHEFEETNEDAVDCNAETGRAAIADGVSQGMFSGLWARILTSQTIESPPDVADLDAFKRWLIPGRAAWSEQVASKNLNFFQRQRLQSVHGGYSTLQWVQFLAQQVTDRDGKESQSEPETAEPGNGNMGASEVNGARNALEGEADDEYVNTAVESNAAEPEEIHFTSYALGDCCLFHVRGERVLDTFPMKSSSEFDRHPMSICSVDRNHDQLISSKFEFYQGTCRDSDLLILATDALAKWLFEQMEADEELPWSELWYDSGEEFAHRVLELRKANRIEIDDTTLLLMRVVQPSPTAAADYEYVIDTGVAEGHDAAVESAGQIAVGSFADLPDLEAIENNIVHVEKVAMQFGDLQTIQILREPSQLQGSGDIVWTGSAGSPRALLQDEMIDASRVPRDMTVDAPDAIQPEDCPITTPNSADLQQVQEVVEGFSDNMPDSPEREAEPNYADPCRQGEVSLLDEQACDSHQVGVREFDNVADDGHSPIDNDQQQDDDR